MVSVANNHPIRLDLAASPAPLLLQNHFVRRSNVVVRGMPTPEREEEERGGR